MTSFLFAYFKKLLEVTNESTITVYSTFFYLGNICQEKIPFDSRRRKKKAEGTHVAVSPRNAESSVMVPLLAEEPRPAGLPAIWGQGSMPRRPTWHLKGASRDVK